jgi:hypothetical protein
VDTFAKLRRDRKGVEWATDGDNSRMSSNERRCAIGKPRSAIDADCGGTAHRALDAAQLAESERRGECGVGAAPNPPASARHSVSDPEAEISRLRRENDRLRMERVI